MTAVLAPYVNLSPGATLAGGVTIGEAALIGMRATVNLNVTDWASGRASATVLPSKLMCLRQWGRACWNNLASPPLKFDHTQNQRGLPWITAGIHLFL
jgi:carbonic anhydrase/acetyltransferase-like protein (isoleucine patch superfamily)